MISCYAVMYAKKGKGYEGKQIQPQSHYYDPIDRSKDRPAGKSRIWGDASEAVQRQVIDSIIDATVKHKLNTRQTALVLAISYVESGFNPDAASNESATGMGQLMNAKAKEYGIDAAHRFDLAQNADALVRLYLENKKTATERLHAGRDLEEHVYQYHKEGAGRYDGQAKDTGGLALAKNRVLPIADNIEEVLIYKFMREHVDPERVRRPSHVRMALSVPKPRTNKKYLDPSSASRLHPEAAETSEWHQQDYYNTKHWNIASRLYHLYHHDDSDQGWTD
jgi:hypothetical protein